MSACSRARSTPLISPAIASRTRPWLKRSAAGCDDSATRPASRAGVRASIAFLRVGTDQEMKDQAAAKQEHVKTAPKFATKEQCEAQFGAANCTTAAAPDGQPATPAQTPGQPAAQGQQTAQSSGSGFFMPLMLGYLGGQMMSRMGQPSQPVYRDAKNTAYAGGSAGAGRSIGNWNPSGGSVATPASARSDASSSTRRSGFGSTATQMSSGSGS